MNAVAQYGVAIVKARAFENRRTETRIGVRVLNCMTEISRPNFEHTA